MSHLAGTNGRSPSKGRLQCCRLCGLSRASHRRLSDPVGPYLVVTSWAAIRCCGSCEFGNWHCDCYNRLLGCPAWSKRHHQAAHWTDVLMLKRALPVLVPTCLINFARRSHSIVKKRAHHPCPPEVSWRCVWTRRFSRERAAGEPEARGDTFLCVPNRAEPASSESTFVPASPTAICSRAPQGSSDLAVPLAWLSGTHQRHT